MFLNIEGSYTVKAQVNQSQIAFYGDAGAKLVLARVLSASPGEVRVTFSPGISGTPDAQAPNPGNEANADVAKLGQSLANIKIEGNPASDPKGQEFSGYFLVVYELQNGQLPDFTVIGPSRITISNTPHP